MGNDDATQLGEQMLADYLKPLGYRTAVVGKTHNYKNETHMEATGINPGSTYAKAAACGGFEPFEKHEGLYPDQILPANQGYSAYLRSAGYDDENPWNSRANSSIDKDGNLHSGWYLRSSAFPAAIPEKHSETAFSTRRAMEFIESTGDQPWCLHLSYIKPHWPIITPEPYHSMYGIADIQPVIQAGIERQNTHPVVDAFMQQEYSASYSRAEVRDVVIPAYMGLVKQLDDHIGQLIAFLVSRGILQNTMIVFTSDHGDYLGDHWLGEKDLFHNPSVKIPFIVVDPSDAADSSRNTSRDDLVEAVDLVPTFVEFAGGTISKERLEGRSLLPLIRSSDSLESWREYAISEIDYSDRGARAILGIEPLQCRAIMIASKNWKFIYYYGYRPQLFDLNNDPNEINDLGEAPSLELVRNQMMDAIYHWQFNLKRRLGLEYTYLEGQGPQRDEEYGIIIGRWQP